MCVSEQYLLALCRARGGRVGEEAYLVGLDLDAGGAVTSHGHPRPPTATHRDSLSALCSDEEARLKPYAGVLIKNILAVHVRYTKTSGVRRGDRGSGVG